MTHSKATLLSRLVIIGILVLLVPWKSEVAPTWKLRVIDQSGKPIPNLPVSQNWIDPNFHGWWLEEDFRTDENGFVSFPKRRAWRNVFLVLGSPVWNRLLFGKQTYVAMAFGWGNYSRGEVHYRSGKVIPTELVMYR